MAKWHENPEGKSEVGEYRDALPQGPARGRGANLNPGNRFETVRLHVLGEHLDALAQEQNPGAAAPGTSDPAAPELSPTPVPTQVFPDKTQTIINRVQSPDMGFDWTLNPYRGCEHGCIYCYARPYHEYLGFSSGIDFETKIMAKFDAPRLLLEELANPRWKAQTIVMSAITDCWQPLEEKLRIARGCLEVLARCRQPVSLITRSRRIVRDLDLIQELARHGAASVMVTMTTLNPRLSASMEPRASSPKDRLDAISTRAAAGVPVMAMLAPTIPGLTDREIPELLQAVAQAGASSAALCMLRLPYQNKALFLEWLSRQFPERAAHVEALLREVFGGKLYQSDFSLRLQGSGRVAGQIRDLFQLFRKRHGLDRPFPSLSSAAFRRPALDGQMELF